MCIFAASVKNSTDIDLIIVGQGIAGTVLALECIDRGNNVLVIDEPRLSACSRVAGGIYNPVVFKRLTKSWLADQVIPVMEEFYHKAESVLGKHFLQSVKIVHVLANADEENLWRKKAVNELADFIEPEIHEPASELSFLKNRYGLVHKSGYLDMPGFLEQTRAFLREKKMLLEEKFDYDGLKTENDFVRYKNFSASKIIFCEGALYRNNPFFSHLKFKPAKGEILTIRSEELKLKNILTKDFFLLPLAGKNLFKLGATYDWDDLTDEPTADAREELEQKLRAAIPFSFEVVKQEAGVRPSTIDRRPVIGFHHTHQNVAVFNGFGTKGVMLAPFFAKHFCSFMENKSALWQEVDVKRFAPVK